MIDKTLVNYWGGVRGKELVQLRLSLRFEVWTELKPLLGNKKFPDEKTEAFALRNVRLFALRHPNADVNQLIRIFEADVR